MASPMAAQRVWPRCRGPVGLAEMNSTLTTRPASAVPLPHAWPASTTVRASSPWLAVSSRMFTKPGPATSAEATPGTVAIRSASRAARSRGGMPLDFARARATPVA